MEKVTLHWVIIFGVKNMLWIQTSVRMILLCIQNEFYVVQEITLGTSASMVAWFSSSGQLF